MSDNTKIEWTDATWNPITGCSVVSPGCTNCYAMRLAGTRLQHHPSRAGLTTPSKAGPVWTGEVRFNEQWLDQPLRWKRPRRIFVCAHGDLFHENVPDEWIELVFAVMALAPQHTFQVLTKRSARMREWASGADTENLAWLINCKIMGRPHYGERIKWPPPNVHLYVSCEDQGRAEERIPDLLATPAAVRGVILEPLLEPISFRWAAWEDLKRESPTNHLDGLRHLDHVIVGGESGPNARPMNPLWVGSIRDECQAAAVPFFFKQWGSWAPWDDGCWSLPAGCDDLEARDKARRADKDTLFLNVGKIAAGRTLDGRTWDEMPEIANSAAALEPKP